MPPLDPVGPVWGAEGYEGRGVPLVGTGMKRFVLMEMASN